MRRAFERARSVAVAATFALVTACTRASVPNVEASPSDASASPSAAATGEIPGLLWVEGLDYGAPSHGGEGQILRARFRLENRSGETVVVHLSDLFVAEDGGPLGERERLSIDSATLDGAATTRADDVPLGPGQRHDLDVWGTGSLERLHYHVDYHHELTFAVKDRTTRVRAGHLWFRHVLPPRP
jgi:hypothetical protein